MSDLLDRAWAVLKSTPIVALNVMLIGIVLPSAIYSLRLDHPTPSQLLVAICIALFSSIVFLWILDATSVLTFRSGWVSKGVYGVAIVSVLGTSVGVYKDAFGSAKRPLEGAWNVTLFEPKTGSVLATHNLLVAYSESSGAYWGYSDVHATAQSTIRATWMSLDELTVTGDNASLIYSYCEGAAQEPTKVRASGKVLRGGKVLEASADGSATALRLTRPH